MIYYLNLIRNTTFVHMYIINLCLNKYAIYLTSCDSSRLIIYYAFRLQKAIGSPHNFVTKTIYHL